ncbi:hypothetical protein LUX29_21480 [Aureimonas altamirensis]|uniref:hypothetical protein n=1 Tax=Aureimonas altamirensis TaxID=370622 RepID=UPI001E524A40|nr:hypothetical protein [Aureimonas altamirensis]UHD45527.1 hypothetical protein LUX29_21480 [Aureimonas altamirensis]
MKQPAVLPVLMRDCEVINVKSAMHRTGRSAKTIVRWCHQDGIGRRSEPGAPWEISAVALEAKRYGDMDAIEALRQGRFEEPRVRRYVEHLGIDV